MPSKKKRKTSKEAVTDFHFHLREVIFIIALAIAGFIVLSLLTYQATDPGWSSTGIQEGDVRNAGGHVGAYIADIFLLLFGYVAYALPIVFAYCTWAVLYDRGNLTEQLVNPRILTLRFIGFVFLLLSACALVTLFFISHAVALSHPGGILGTVLTNSLLPVFNFFGMTLLLFATFLVAVTLATGISWFAVMEMTGKLALKFLLKSWETIQSLFHGGIPLILQSIGKLKRLKGIKPKITVTKPSLLRSKPEIKTPEPYIEPKINRVEPSVRAYKEQQVTLFTAAEDANLPALNLLDKPQQTVKGESHASLQKTSRNLEAHLQDFNIEAKVVAVHPGPVITRYELQLAPGIKVNKVSTLAKDLARSLSVTSVRVVEVIPGKPYVGLEVPNEHREVVFLSEVLSSKQYDSASSILCIALGKDIAGHPFIVDLARMPHLLVAGTTGSGKSVSINTMLLSLLYKATPQQLRLVLIDPKMLELSVYNDIPHLLTPVVTDMKKAVNVLRWCIAEMERRYGLMAALGVRNLANYNKKIKEAEKKNKPILDPTWQQEEGKTAPKLQELPFVVVIIDELADMMMVVGKKVEQLIARIAQKARASGIHLILATQRPSVDVITGLIKANIPTRVAFQVSSKVDSRTIIDQQGAEQLIGNGDMLYLPPGTGIPLRVHGAFVADHEVHKVVAELRKQGKPDYMDEILDGGVEQDASMSFIGNDEDESDPLYDQAVQIVIETRRASISSIQRRLKIGYNRAARLVEDMEKAGLVGSMESNGQREILIPAQAEE